MAPKPTVRGVFSRAVATLRGHWRTLLLVALVVFVPLGFLEVLDERFAELDPDAFDTADAIAALAVSAIWAATELFGEIMLAGVAAAAVGDVHGRREARSLREVLRQIPYGRLAAITLISVAGFVLGMLLLVVPAIVLFARFALAAPAAEVEHLGVRAAFARSNELSRGHSWLVLGVLFPLALLSGAVGEGAQLLIAEVVGESHAGEWAGAIVAGVLTAIPWALAAVALVFELRDAEAGGGMRARTRSTPPPRR